MNSQSRVVEHWADYQKNADEHTVYLTWFLSKPIHSDPHPLPYKLPLQRVCYETIQI